MFRVNVGPIIACCANEARAIATVKVRNNLRFIHTFFFFFPQIINDMCPGSFGTTLLVGHRKTDLELILKKVQACPVSLVSVKED